MFDRVWEASRETAVCFSPEGDMVAGVIVLGIGLDAALHTRHQPAAVATSAIPVLLGLHQIDEAFVWWGLQGHVPAGLGRVAMWIYLYVAMVVLPALVPALLLWVEPERARRWRIAPFVLLGMVTAAVILETMLTGHPSVRLAHLHLAYSIGLGHGVTVIGCYIVATCGPLFLSSLRWFRWFGAANLVAVVTLAILVADGFTSLWCLYAALVSAAIAWHLRASASERGRTDIRGAAAVEATG